jgi:hypothetical protein
VEVLRVDAFADPDEAWRLVIRLDYRVRASLNPGVLTLSLDLAADTDPGVVPAAPAGGPTRTTGRAPRPGGSAAPASDPGGPR